eukprot:TRINITY_DN2050_c0_g1_i1.p1 TRINITY_DN2050_c0_g1~~TRINITY_DN2050_c0_g1_i1.p1  ORF type:complete len:409 (+),score=75.20 TRINITY_DN2050_c0_g1_i1:233-1459(+)
MGLSWGPDGADSGIPLYNNNNNANNAIVTTSTAASAAMGTTTHQPFPLRSSLQLNINPVAKPTSLTKSMGALPSLPAQLPARTLRMPVMAIGTWQLDANGIRKALRTAVVECGYRAIDCASIYQNENEVGEVLEEIFAMKKKVNNVMTSDPLIRREDLFITSKLWNDAHVSRGGGDRHRVFNACKQTLRDLRLDYLDLYLVNFPVGFVSNTVDATVASQINANASLTDTWEAMQELVELGLVRAIGVANFEREHLEIILKSPNTSIKPLVNQIETHPYLLRNDLIQYCHNKGIAVCAYAPLGSPNNPWSKLGFPKLLDDDVVVDLAEKYGKTPAQILLRWALQRGNLGGLSMGVVVKSEHADHIRSNVKVFDFRLSEDDMKELESRNRGTRFVHPITPWLGRGSFRRA